ncbi:effector protein NopP [Bradyrhizobium sp. NAS80.1]|uniref:effector protein NopP n=1 Tax=Bradyrhizobium sp. NAS80.1 TaxID=1680159 RepID=UPI0009635635|nr:effector protein NopP [Bradyrhizobium sp. NAS80.1]OKO79010.1 effector protein NopP [Bradyrhizobium sp. NAS80.1]
MYGRINDWSDIPSDETYYRGANAEHADAEGQGFADAFARMRLQDSAGCSSSRPHYSLVSRPPVVEIDRATFRREVRNFHGDEINRIANNPHEYSAFVSERAKRTAGVAKEYGIRRDSEEARYYSYQLGNMSVGLQRTEGGFSMTDFESDRWREQFPGRSEVTSIVDFQVAHPLVTNAGDILLEHQLRQDGERPLVNWRPANAEAKARAQTMGFVEVDEDDMVLDPTQSGKWEINSAGEWQRATSSRRYLSKADSDTEVTAGSDEDGDFM